MPHNQLERKQMQRKPITYLPLGTALSDEVAALRDQFRKMFGEPFVMSDFPTSLGWAPAIEIAETNEELTLKAELPGVKKEDVKVTFEDGMLTIEGEKRDERREKDEKRQFHIYERNFGRFARSFTLPNAIDNKHISAKFHDGVLTVHLPKSADSRRDSKPIEITD